MLDWLVEKIDIVIGEENFTHDPVSPEVGAVALLIEAGYRDGEYTDEGRHVVESSVSALFDLTPTDARALYAQAEAAQAQSAWVMRFCTAAKKLSAGQRDQLITALWAVVDQDGRARPNESMLISSVIDVFNITSERAQELRR